MMTAISLIILFISLYLRLFPRLKWKEFNGTDGHFHHYYVDLIRRNNNKIPAQEARVLGGSNECTYPYFYHWLLSFLPAKVMDFMDRFSGFLFDLAGGLILLFLIRQYVDFSFSEGCLILSAYIIAPGLTFSFIGPRPYSLTPRNFSQLVFALACAGLIMMVASGGFAAYAYFLFSAAMFAVLLLSSQFGLQVLIAILIVGFINWPASVAILTGALISLLFNKGFVVDQIKAQYMHLEWYFRHNYSFVQHKTNFSKLAGLIKQRDIRGVFYELVFFNQISTTVLRHTTYFLALWLGYMAWQEGGLLAGQYQALLLLIPSVFAFVVTNFGRARVFGEAERYIEFMYPIQMFLFFSLLPYDYWMWALGIMIVYNMVWYAYNLYQIKSQSASTYSYQPLFELLNSANVTLLCLGNNESYLFLRNTAAKIVGFLVNISLRGQYAGFFEKFFIKYPCVDPACISEMIDRYAITHILQNKITQEAQTYNYAAVVNASGQYRTVFEDEKYILYEKI